MRQKVLGISAIMFCAVLIIGCKIDPLLGKWSLTDDGGYIHKFEFKADKTFTYEVLNPNADAVIEDKNGTYTEQCGTLTLIVANEPDAPLTYAVNCNSLIFVLSDPIDHAGVYTRE